MDVFLIPVGSERYELYCEVADVVPEIDPSVERGFFKNMMVRFREMLAAAERERRESMSASSPPAGERRRWTRRYRDRAMRWVAEKIAEQRLLWNLRQVPDARLVFPADMDAQAAMEIVRTQLRRETDRHRFWLVVDGTGFILSGAVMLVPGPNVLAYYFAFRVVGHYLSMRGARHGLQGVAWDQCPHEALAELRQVSRLDPEQRSRRVHELASLLRLQHLAAFFERTAISS